MNRAAYLDAVAAELRGLTEFEKASVRRELEGHIEDHAEALRALGFSEDEAEERAAAQMGDPVETGRGIAALYHPFWLWVERIAGVLTAVLTIELLLGFGVLGNVWSSLRARACTPRDETLLRLDEHMAVGDDVVWLYGISGYRPGEKCEVELWLSAYDRSPFGVVQQNIWNALTFEADGAQGKHELRWLGGGSGGNAGAEHLCVRLLLEAGDTGFTLRYERFGEVAEITVDLTEVLS